MGLKNYSGKGFTQDFLRLMADWKKTRECCANFLVGIVTQNTASVIFTGDGTKLHPLTATATAAGTLTGADNGLSLNGTIVELGGTLLKDTTVDEGAFALSLLQSLTGASAKSILSLSPTWNTSGSPTAVLLNVTNTASGANALLADLQVGGTSQLKLTKGGILGMGIGSALPIAGTLVHLNNGGAFSASLPTLGPLTITGTNLAYITLIGANNTANAECGIIAMRARGTLAAPLAVQSGDFLAAYIAAAYDGGARQTPGALEFYAETGVAGPVIPTRACLSTGTFGGDRLPHLAVDHLGHTGIGQNMTSAPITAWLHIVTASDGTAGRAPLKFTAGTNLVTPENGAMEFDGTHLYITIGGVRTTIV